MARRPRAAARRRPGRHRRHPRPRVARQSHGPVTAVRVRPRAADQARRRAARRPGRRGPALGGPVDARPARLRRPLPDRGSRAARSHVPQRRARPRAPAAQLARGDPPAAERAGDRAATVVPYGDRRPPLRPARGAGRRGRDRRGVRTVRGQPSLQRDAAPVRGYAGRRVAADIARPAREPPQRAARARPPGPPDRRRRRSSGPAQAARAHRRPRRPGADGRDPYRGRLADPHAGGHVVRVPARALSRGRVRRPAPGRAAAAAREPRPAADRRTLAERRGPVGDDGGDRASTGTPRPTWNARSAARWRPG